jgi:hypothetical protein
MSNDVPFDLASSRTARAGDLQSSGRRQIIIGACLGIGFGIWNMLHSLLVPLAEDTIPALLIFYGPMFTIWAVMGFIASRTTGRVVDGIKASAIVAFVTFLVFDLMVILRVNIFLYSLVDRLDWQNLIMRFRESGSRSLRAFITYDYIVQSPLKIFVATAIGAVTGVIGGVIGGVRSHLRSA